MDHSCAPNAVWISKGKELVIRCISEEKIEKISDLRISYIPNLYESTGKSLSEALLFAEHGESTYVVYKKNSECQKQFLYTTCPPLV